MVAAWSTLHSMGAAEPRESVRSAWILLVSRNLFLQGTEEIILGKFALLLKFLKKPLYKFFYVDGGERLC